MPVLSQNTEYRCAYTDLLFRLRFIHCAMVSPFILHCFPFSLTGKRKGEKFTEELALMNSTVCTYYGTLLVKCTCAWASSIKIIIKCITVVDWFKSARMVSCWDLYVCSWAVICQYSWWCYQASMTIDWKIISSYTMNYEICNILCLDK